MAPEACPSRKRLELGIPDRMTFQLNCSSNCWSLIITVKREPSSNRRPGHCSLTEDADESQDLGGIGGVRYKNRSSDKSQPCRDLCTSPMLAGTEQKLIHPEGLFWEHTGPACSASSTGWWFGFSNTPDHENWEQYDQTALHSDKRVHNQQTRRKESYSSLLRNIMDISRTKLFPVPRGELFG